MFGLSCTDCPQVQTIQRFVPSEPDELALEESDIVDVLRKTKDGKSFISFILSVNL